MCENEGHNAKVTVLPDGDGSNTGHGKAAPSGTAVVSSKQEMSDPHSGEYSGKKLSLPDSAEKSTYEKSLTTVEQVNSG